MLHILQLVDQGLLWRAPRTRIPLNRPLIDHDGEGETRMVFRFRHHQLRTLINRIVGAVPVNDHAIDAPADHVVNLPLDLSGIGGAVADIHVLRSAEPR